MEDYFAVEKPALRGFAIMRYENLTIADSEKCMANVNICLVDNCARRTTNRPVCSLH